MPTDEELFGGPAGVARVDAYIDALVAKAPPLTAGQKVRLRTLLRPAPAEAAPQATPRRAAA